MDDPWSVNQLHDVTCYIISLFVVNILGLDVEHCFSDALLLLAAAAAAAQKNYRRVVVVFVPPTMYPKLVRAAPRAYQPSFIMYLVAVGTSTNQIDAEKDFHT